MKNKIKIALIIISIATLVVGCNKQAKTATPTDINNSPTQLESPSTAPTEEKTVSTETSKPVQTHNGLKCEVA